MKFEKMIEQGLNKLEPAFKAFAQKLSPYILSTRTQTRTPWLLDDIASGHPHAWRLIYRFENKYFYSLFMSIHRKQTNCVKNGSYHRWHPVTEKQMGCFYCNEERDMHSFEEKNARVARNKRALELFQLAFDNPESEI